MNLRSATVLASLLATSSPAMALDFGPGFSLTGYVELEYGVDSDSDYPIGLSDLTLSWHNASDSGIDFGFELAFESFDILDEGDSRNQLWGGLVLSTDYGNLTIGSPRPLLDTFELTPNVGAFWSYSLELALYTRSYMGFVGLLDPDFDIWGATFAGSQGAFSYGIGAHQADDGVDLVNTVELVASYQFGNTKVYGAYEAVDPPGPDARKFILGMRHDAERWSIGAEASRFDDGGPIADVNQLFGEYRFTNGLAVGVQFLDLEFASSNQFVGLSATYDFGQGGYAELGYTFEEGSDDLFSASIGLNF